MSWCPDPDEVLTIQGREGVVVELIGVPCTAFVFEFMGDDGFKDRRVYELEDVT